MEPQPYPDSTPGFTPLRPEQVSSTDGTQKLSLRPRLPEIDLTSVQLDATASHLLSLDLMRQFRVVPFAYDAETKALKVACISPHDRHLIDQLSSRTGGMHVELFAAQPSVIDATISRLKNDSIAQQCEQPSGDLPSTAATDQVVHSSSAADENRKPSLGGRSPAPHHEPVNVPDRGSLLFVTPKGKISEHLLFAYTAERYAAKVVSSVAAACEAMSGQSFDHVFVHDSFRNSCDTLTLKLHERNVDTELRFFDAEVSLLVSAAEDHQTQELMTRNLHLFRYLHNGPEPSKFTHAAEVARIADLLAARFDLKSRIRYAIATAASLHDLSQTDLMNREQYAQTDIIALAAGRLAALAYPTLIVDLLRSMYRKYSHTSSSPCHHTDLAGVILTAADIYCHNRPNHTGVTAEDRREAISKLRETVSPYAPDEVVGKLMDIALVDLRHFAQAGAMFQVHIFSESGSLEDTLRAAFTGAGLAVSVSRTAEDCAQAFKERAPQALVLHHQGHSRALYDLILALALKGVTIDRTPTILLLEQAVALEAMAFIKHGIEDVFPASVSVDALVTKLARLRSRLDEKTLSRLAVLKELGTHGSLEDMNLIDLLEASRGSNRPSHISVSANGQHLTVVIDKGVIIRAEANDTSGIDAIQQGIAWKQGVWSIDPIDPSELPPPNLDKGIDSVLLEACVRHDTAARP